MTGLGLSLLRVGSANNAVLHELQKERGASVIYLASDGERFGNELELCRADMDHAFLALIEELQTYRQDILDTVAAEREHAIVLLERLPELRTAIDDCAVSSSEIIQYFTDLNQSLLLANGAAALAVPSQAQRSALVALLAISRAKELVGIERALLSQVFGADRFAAGNMVHLVSLIAGQESLLRIFDQLATDDVRDELTRLQAHPAVVRARRLETLALSNGVGELGVDPVGWYMAMTQRIDLLRAIELSQLRVAEASLEAPDEPADPEVDEALHAAVAAMRELRGVVDRVQVGDASIREVLRGSGDALGSASRQLAAARRTAERMAELAVTDALTGLPNRSVADDLVRTALARAGRAGTVAALTLDLDHFKVVNDSMGHAVGDRLLAAVAERLRQTLRSTDSVARIGGDEFLVVLEPVAGVAEAQRLADRLIEAVRLPIDLDGSMIRASMSVGVAVSEPEDAVEDLLRASDIAVYEAKRLGRDRVVAFDAALRAESVDRHRREQKLRRDLDLGDLAFRRSPVIGPRGDVLATEVGIAWEQGDDRLAATSGLSARIVAHTARRAISEWADDPDEGGVLLRMPRETLALPSLVDELLAVAEHHHMAPSDLWISVTEAGVRSSDVARRQLDRLGGHGCVLVLDDFGTASSSMRALWDFPVHFLRLDLGRVPDDDRRTAALGATTHLAQLSSMGVIACGVADDEVDELFGLGLAGVQGPHVSAAQPSVSR